MYLEYRPLLSAFTLTFAVFLHFFIFVLLTVSKAAFLRSVTWLKPDFFFSCPVTEIWVKKEKKSGEHFSILSKYGYMCQIHKENNRTRVGKNT